MSGGGESGDVGNPGTLGMTKRRGLLEGEDRCQGTGRLLGRWGRRSPPSQSTAALLCEIKKVTTSRDDKKERKVVRRGRLLNEKAVIGDAREKGGLRSHISRQPLRKQVCFSCRPIRRCLMECLLPRRRDAAASAGSPRPSGRQASRQCRKDPETPVDRGHPRSK
jgi:hypothetical protein